MADNKFAAYICTGCGLGDKLDIKTLEKIAQKEGKMQVVKSHPFLCNAEGIQMINDDIANVVIAQLLFLDSEEPEKDIMLYINSPGGHVSAGLAIYDTMQYLHCDVATICMGQAASMGSFLLAAGTKGKRYALPHSRVMIHQPLAGFQGQATDIDIHAREILKTRDTLNELYSKHTGQPADKIKHDTERDNFMSASQAKEYGIIDEVLITAKKKPDDKK